MWKYLKKKNYLARLFLQRILITKPWLIAVHMALPGNTRTLQPCPKSAPTAPNSICSRVQLWSCLSVRQDWMSGMCECSRHVRFYSTLSDQRGSLCWQITGRGVVCSTAAGSCVNRPGRLSPAPAEWWPGIVQPRKDGESELVIFMFPLRHDVDHVTNWRHASQIWPLFPFLSSP